MKKPVNWIAALILFVVASGCFDGNPTYGDQVWTVISTNAEPGKVLLQYYDSVRNIHRTFKSVEPLKIGQTVLIRTEFRGGTKVECAIPVEVPKK